MKFNRYIKVLIIYFICFTFFTSCNQLTFDKAYDLYKTGNYEKASIIFESMLAEDEDNIDALEYLASCYMELGKNILAIETYEKLIKVSDQENENLGGIAYFNLAKLLYQEKRFEDCLEYLNKGLLEVETKFKDSIALNKIKAQFYQQFKLTYVALGLENRVEESQLMLEKNILLYEKGKKDLRKLEKIVNEN